MELPHKSGMSKKICMACGTVGAPKTVTKGSFAIELVLWICFIIPGLIYSIWRLTSRHPACKACGSPQLVPLNSPIGKRMITDLQSAQVSPPPPAESKQPGS